MAGTVVSGNRASITLTTPARTAFLAAKACCRFIRPFRKRRSPRMAA
jgi:hypothetical protein